MQSKAEMEAYAQEIQAKSEAIIAEARQRARAAESDLHDIQVHSVCVVVCDGVMVCLCLCNFVPPCVVVCQCLY